MPFCTDPDHRPGQSPQPPTHSSPPRDIPSKTLRTPLSEESIRTEFCEGPVPDPDYGAHGSEIGERSAHLEPSAAVAPNAVTSDRAELIERIKRGETPRWLPKRQPDLAPAEVVHEPNGGLPNQSRPEQSLLPAIELKGPIRSDQPADLGERVHSPSLGIGLAIERPRSALHSGNFTDDSRTSSDNTSFARAQGAAQRAAAPLSIRTTSQPLSTPVRASSSNFSRPILKPSPAAYPKDGARDAPFPPTRPRAPSLQSPLSYSFRSPTSPLVQQSSHDDDENEPGLRGASSSKDGRRRTLPAEFLQSLRLLPSSIAQAARQPQSFQQESISFSYSAREARRSATFSSPFLTSASPPTPNFLRSRRSSFSSEAQSPLQQSSMVGSYEESILRGRMSSMPSRPVEFTAQIGALGKDDFKPKHPAHVTLTFPAVFYNWSPADMPTTAEPSPYVGQMDLEHGLQPPAKRQKKAPEPQATGADRNEQPASPKDATAERRPPRRRHRSPSPSRIPLGGCYRIAQRGQLQILIKNPNKTAVKLFLIPYSLDGMEAGTKTFIRQNCYTAGPIIESPLTSKSPAESAADSKPALNDPRNKPKLRYSIHLHICCPSKGRFYLYKEIKVVFANRVPDNKERLRTEIRLPEPRFSPWRPLGDQVSSPSAAGARRSLELQHRRRSSQTSLSRELGSFEMRHKASFGSGSADPAAPPVPMLPSRDAPMTGGADYQRPADSGAVTQLMADLEPRPRGSEMQSPRSEQLAQAGSSRSGSMRSSSSNDSSASSYNKLSRGDVGYGGLFGRPGTPEASGSLLSRKLRRLEEERPK